jgi:hypothetical protein
MLIPNKFNGYSRDGVRKYYMGGGAPVSGGAGSGGGFGGSAAPAPAQQNYAPQQNTNMNMVNQAYGNIGRASVGTGANQIDQGGQDYWMNQLNSGAIAPQDFAQKFAQSAQIAQPETANRYQNQALSQISGARPNSTGPQYYQPVQQQNYQNYANPQSQMGVSQYGQQPSGMPQMQTPFNPYTNSYQQAVPMANQYQQPMAPRVSSGPSQAIVSRSAQMRGTPNVMARKAEGGIASLVDE